VFIPETWSRTQRERESQFTFVKLALAALSGVILVAGLVFAASQWTRHRFDRRALWTVAALSFGLAAATLANNAPQIGMNLKTSEPVINQVALSVIGALLGAVFVALIAGLVTAIGAWSATQRPEYRFAQRWRPWVAGASAALIVAGFDAALSALAPQTSPIWPTYGLAGQAFPGLGAAIVGAGVLGAIGAALFVLAWLERVTHGWHKHLWLAAIMLVLTLTAIALAGSARPLAALISGAITGAAAVVIVYGVLRFDLRTVPAYIATGVVLGLVESGAHNATRVSYLYAAVAIVAAILMTIAVVRYLDRSATGATLAEGNAPVAGD